MNWIKDYYADRADPIDHRNSIVGPWLTLKQTRPTILERMGGYPEVLLQGSVDLSDRDVRKAQVLKQVQARHDRS